MDPLLEAALRQGSWTRAILVRLDLPDGVACFTDGGVVAFDCGDGDGAEIYWSNHPTWGLLNGVPTGMGSSTGGQNTRVDIGFLPKDAETTAALTDPLNQGVRVRVWRGAVNRTTGALIGAPSLRFDGELDTPSMTVGENGRVVTWECGTEADLQLEDNSDWRLNHALQSKIWPGDDGLANVVNVVNATRNMEWRT